jgi:hypothetical protein
LPGLERQVKKLQRLPKEVSAEYERSVWGDVSGFAEGAVGGKLMIRTIAIWIFGLLAAAIIGGFLGSAYDAHFYPYGGGGIARIYGVIGGMCAFTCLRLWLAPKSK